MSNQLCTGFNYITNVRQLAELASILGYASDAQRLTALAATLLDKFNAAFCQFLRRLN